MAFLAELWMFVRARKKWWLLPITLVILTFGILLLLAQSAAISPFLYALF